jgi:dephospho-CoA kinase
MPYNSNVKILAFVGLSGSGKTAAVDYLTSKGHPKVYFGGVLYQAMEEAHIEPTWENQNTFRVDIREKEGTDFIVKRIITQMHNLIESGQNRIVADGLYSWDEYKILKHEFPGELTVIAIVAPKRLRHSRLATRPERPLTQAEADNRDWHEIEDIKKGGPIAIADHFVSNDGDIEKLHRAIDAIVSDLEF